MPNPNVYNAFMLQVRERSDAPAIIFPDLSFSYDKVNRLAAAFASKMSSAGVGTSSTIMVQCSDPLIVIATLLAVSRLGASIVQDNEGLSLPPDLKVTHHFHTIEPERTPAAGSILIDTQWSPSLNPQQKEVAEVDPEKPWLYVYTSGTTGLPKFLAWTQRMVCDRSQAVAADFVPGKTRFASLMPSNSRAFIARAMAALLNGATIVDGKDIEFWRQAGVTMVSGSVAQMLGFFGRHSPDRRFPLAEVFGSKLSKSDTHKLLQSFECVHDVFGASEANKLFANVSTLGPDGKVVTRGQALDSRIEIIDIEGNLAPPGMPGTLRVRNPYLATGYLSDPVATRESFRDGWFYPGDVATWGEHGTLEVFSRTDNILNIGGVKINALILDHLLRSIEGIRDAICFKHPRADAPNQLFAFVVFEEGCNRLQVMEIARQQCREKLGKAMVPDAFRSIGGVPRTPDGMPDRKACAVLLLEIDKRREAEAASSKL
jgi:acyl-coenzyme A synthetase/AMP-(fatty) acid ligase